MIIVIHKKYSDKYVNVVYVGRGSALGNPYTSIKGRETMAKYVVDSREESIEKFREYICDCIEKKEEKVCEALNQIYKLSIQGDVYISCYCKPKSCHGDIIKEVIESKMEKQKSPSIDSGIQLNLFDDINKD